MITWVLMRRLRPIVIDLVAEMSTLLEDLRESDRTEVLVAQSAEVMPNVKEILREAMLDGTPGQRKALLKEPVVEERAESRDGVVPTFRLPTAPVRVTEAAVAHGKD